jgi:hypothetical protein
MTISTSNIKLKRSERLTDLDDGGGRQTSVEVVDGELNNLFQDISRLDRVTGRVSLRKAFFHVDSPNTDTLLGAHAILIQPPADDYTHISMFRTGSQTDERSNAQNRIESYVIAGPESQWGLYGTHIVGTRLLRLYCRSDVPNPDAGSVLLLSTEAVGYADDQQYVRVDSVESRATQIFTDEAGDYERDVILCTIGSQIRTEFYGADTPPRRSSSKPLTRVRITQVADAARYFSVQPLAVEADEGALFVRVDSPYVPLVPTATAESALVDQTPYRDASALVVSGPADALTVSVSTSGDSVDNSRTLYFGSSFGRGTLRVTRGSVVLKDNGDSSLVPLTPGGATDGYSGACDYESGTFTLTRDSSWTGTVSATATAAGLFIAPPFTRETRITLGNRGYVYTWSCVPLPAPGTVTVSYRALGRWYTLRDNGAGLLIGAGAGEGSGSVNYSTGSIDVTLGALPDVDSSLLASWGTPRTADARYGDVAITAPVVRHTLDHPPEPGSLTITWLAGGVTRTATAATSGAITGAVSAGQLSNATGELWFRPSLIPDANTTFEFAYQRETSATSSPTGSVSGQTVTGTISASGAIRAGSISLSIPYQRTESGTVFGTGDKLVVDNGSGGWRDFYTGATMTGTIDYDTGAFSVTFGSTTTERVPQYTYSQVQGYPWVWQTLTGYNNVTSSLGPVAGPIAARYRLDSVTSEPQTDTIDGPSLVIDLTPGVSDQVVSGSVRVTVAGRTYVDRGGSLYYGVSPTTGAGTLGGEITLSSGEIALTDYVGGGAANAATINSLLTVKGEAAINAAFFRVPAQSLKPASLAIRANRVDTGALITGTSDINGVITGTGISGEVDAEMGIVRVVFGELVTAAGNEGEPWYVAGAVSGGQIRRPILVDPSSVRYNVVTLKSIPIDAEIVGLDPVRLPVDGRVPWVRPGDVAVIHNTAVTSVATPVAASTTSLGRTNMTHIRVRDSEGEPILSTWYTLDLDAGTVTWADPLDLSAYTLPALIEHRVEDMVQVSDALITGEVYLARALSRDYPVGSYLSTALVPVPQDLAAGVSNLFAQATWTGVWSDTLIGDAPSASYNDLAYPVVVRNDRAVTGRFRIQFTSPTAFTCYLEDVGGIGSGTINVDFSPTNPLTGQPYFTIDANGWGSGWASGNVLRFNVQGATAPIWLARCTLPGPIDEPADSVRLELRGDAD